MKEPLDNLRLEIYKNGIVKNVPALHNGWVEQRLFIHYIPPPCSSNLAGLELEVEDLALEQEAWLDRTKFFQDDIEWLLRLPYHRFWSQVVYDQNVHDCLNSFLVQAPRYFDTVNIYLTPEMIARLETLFHRVFLVYIRMGTFKESKESQLTPQKFGEMIYENYIFDIPKLMDLSVLYCMSNKALLQKLVENIFKTQVKYLDDLSDIVTTFFVTLDNVQTQLGLSSSDNKVIQTIENGQEQMQLKSMLWNEFEDICLFLVDISVTISAFLDVYPPAAEVFHKNEVPIRIARFYELVIPALENDLNRRMQTSEANLTRDDVQRKMTLIKRSLLKTFHEILDYCCLQPLRNSNDKREMRDLFAEDYLQQILAAMSEKSFITDYEKKFPIEMEIDFLQNCDIKIDATRFQYVLDNIYSLPSCGGKLPPKQQEESQTVRIPEEVKLDPRFLYGEGACVSSEVKGAELQSLVTQVKDLFPEYGNKFIEVCLEYYNYAAEDVINAILEGSLPKYLDDLDHTCESNGTAAVDSNPQTITTEDRKIESDVDWKSNSVLAQRRNIFDHDEFDIFNTSDVDRTKVFKGKRPSQYKKNELLNDKSYLDEKARRFYEENNIVIDTIEVDLDDYEDEYDDTYDEYAVGASEPDRIEHDEILSRRPFVTPRVLAKPEVVSDDDSNDLPNGFIDTSEEKEENKRDCFVSNPEELRQKAEERWRQKMGRGRGFGGGSLPNRDLKGKPKGQGQDDKVLKNRNFKEKHKSSSANHNRKNASTWKRSRGMFPS